MFKNLFLKNFSILMLGTVLAQLIPIVASPFLTRLFTPEAFGLYGTYSAISVILAVFISARYDLAILTVERDDEANILLGGFVYIACIVSFIITLIGCFFIILYELDPIFIVLIVLGASLIAINSAYTNWLLRNKKFIDISLNRVLLSFSIIFFQITLFFIFDSIYSLVIGNVIAAFVLNIFLRKRIKLNSNFNQKKFIRTVIDNNRFPRKIMIAHVMNGMANQLPMIAVGLIFGLKLAGFFYLVQRVLATPISVFVKNIADLFKQQVSQAFNRNLNVRKIYIKYLLGLCSFSLLPFLFFYYYCVDFFVLVFGKEWSQAGEICQLMLPMFFLKFIVSPLTTIFVILKKDFFELLWQSFFLSTTIFSLIIGLYFKDFIFFINTLTILYSAIYCFVLVLSYLALRVKYE